MRGRDGDIDAGRPFDWGRTSADYGRYRPGPPDSYYEKLRTFGIGREGQRLLDLGTGTGLLARRFAAQGAVVTGIDVAPEQILEAQRQADAQGLAVDFSVAAAEALPFADASFDVVTANQCWWYFDQSRAVPEVLRVLAADGCLMESQFSFLPRLDATVAASERLVLEFNPDWSGADWDGRIPARPGWSRQHFTLRAMYWYDEAIAFTRESWRGRMRALRGIGASLPPDAVEAFDARLDALLREIVPEQFDILHRISVHIFEPLAG
ncbi:MAG: class I SAM-dependent methyltransferase [Pseudomonadales bacterium]